MCGLGCGGLGFEDSESWLSSSCRVRTVGLLRVLCGSRGWGTQAPRSQTYTYLPPTMFTRSTWGAPGPVGEWQPTVLLSLPLFAVGEEVHPPFQKKCCCISLYFITVVNICLASGPLQANAFVSNSSDSVLAWCFIRTEELHSRRSGWIERPRMLLQGLTCWEGWNPRTGEKHLK